MHAISLKRAAPAMSTLLLFCLWTVLLGQGAWTQLDATVRFTPPAMTSPAGQIAGTITLLTWPGIQYLSLVIGGAWMIRHRLRRLGVSAIIAALTSGTMDLVVMAIVARPRPSDAMGLMTILGASYPCSTLTAAGTVSTMAIVLAAATRQSRDVRRGVAVVSGLFVAVVTIDQLFIRAGYLSDLIGGLLLGVTLSIWVVTVADIRPEFLPRRATSSRVRALVIVNPTKVTNWTSLRQSITHEADRAGLRIDWRETSPSETTFDLVAEALRREPVLVVAAGGDGTVREVSSALADVDIPMGIIPLGTGNLLARNLGIPLDVQDAIAVAFGSRERTIDLVRLTADDVFVTHFAVMGGMGVDAALMAATNSELKRIVGPAAYVLAAPQALASRRFTSTITMDDESSIQTDAAMVLVGNVGTVFGAIQLLPDALPDDGVLDVVVASPRGVADWARIAGRVISGADDPDELVRITGQRVTIEVEGNPVDYQLDGDTVGTCTHITAEIVPGALQVKVP